MQCQSLAIKQLGLKDGTLIICKQATLYPDSIFVHDGFGVTTVKANELTPR